MNNQEAPKTWLVLRDVLIDELEKVLNEQAERGYHLHEKEDAQRPGFGIPKSYNLIFINPTVMGAARMKEMQEMLNQATGGFKWPPG